MFKYANSGQYKLNVNKLPPTYIRQKNLVSRQFMCTCSNNKLDFIKNDIPAPILESQGMHVIFQKKGKKMLKKGQKTGKIVENLGKNVQNLKIF